MCHRCHNKAKPSESPVGLGKSRTHTEDDVKKNAQDHKGQSSEPGYMQIMISVKKKFMRDYVLLLYVNFLRNVNDMIASNILLK